MRLQHQRAALEIGSKQRHKKRRLTSAQVAMQVLSSVETTARNVQANDDDDDDDYEYEFLDDEAKRIHLEQKRRRARQSKENVAEVDNRGSVGSVGIE